MAEVDPTGAELASVLQLGRGGLTDVVWTDVVVATPRPSDPPDTGPATSPLGRRASDAGTVPSCSAETASVAVPHWLAAVPPGRTSVRRIGV